MHIKEIRKITKRVAGVINNEVIIDFMINLDRESYTWEGFVPHPTSKLVKYEMDDCHYLDCSSGRYEQLFLYRGSKRKFNIVAQDRRTRLECYTGDGNPYE